MKSIAISHSTQNGPLMTWGPSLGLRRHQASSRSARQLQSTTLITRIIGLGQIGERLCMAIHDAGRVSAPEHGVIEYTTLPSTPSRTALLDAIDFVADSDFVAIIIDLTDEDSHSTLVRLFSTIPNYALVVVGCCYDDSTPDGVLRSIRAQAHIYHFYHRDRTDGQDLIGGISTMIATYSYRGLICIDFSDVRAIVKQPGGFIFGSSIGPSEDDAFYRLLAQDGMSNAISSARGIVATLGVNLDVKIHDLGRIHELFTSIVDRDASVIFDIKVTPEIGSDYKLSVVATGL